MVLKVLSNFSLNEVYDIPQAVASRIVGRQTPDAHLITEERKRKNYAEFWNVIPVTEPYRCVLSEVRDKLYHTR